MPTAASPLALEDRAYSVGAVDRLVAAPRGRLTVRGRRAMLVAHIVAAGAWIGTDVVLGVLVVTGVLTGDDNTRALAYEALGLVAVWPLIVAGLATLATGIGLGLVTRYGLVRYWWVVAKLAITIVLVTLVAFALRPGVAEAVRHGEAIRAGIPSDAEVDTMVFPPAVSLAALIVATILSVFKPWGRIPRRSTAIQSPPAPTVPANRPTNQS